MQITLQSVHAAGLHWGGASAKMYLSPNFPKHIWYIC